MRIGIVWPDPTRLAVLSIRFERYREGFRRLGHEAIIISTAEAAEGFEWADVSVPTLAALRDPALYAGLRLDAALVLTWLGLPDIMAAVRPHVRHLISLSDSDGVIGVQVFPARLLSRMVLVQTNFGDRLRTAGWWLRQYLGIYRGVDRGLVESGRLADRIIVFSPGAKENLRGFFSHHGEEALVSRIVVAPFPVGDDFEHDPVSADREDRVIAIGRWDDPQKGVGLLVAGLERYLRAGGRWKFTLLGRGGENAFRSLLATFPDRVEYRGAVAQDKVAALLGRARVLLSTSRWESGPIVASEAMLRGCSLVGPASIPSFVQFCEAGCGTTFVRRSASAVAAALGAEAEAWATGRRDPAAIAARWRGYFTPEAVSRRLLDGLDAPRAALTATGSA
jgi:glycosyltransferase involved in cell wall biosynthesis